MLTPSIRTLFALHTGGTLLGLLILILDVFAIVSVLMGASSVERKLLWIVVILLLPVIGMILYFLFGRSAADAY